ncbi:nucleotidyltransferase domain-containing protein [Candidatus Saccharibacteria bacterium]|nr:nucleotidyltransferase domain-containing protein [Candidatus Saccharibacteria bacterium]
MNEEVFTTEEIKTRLKPVFVFYNVKEARLFGSYAKKTATKKSDVDLCVNSGLKGLRFVGLIESMRKALGDKEVDVFDVSHIKKGSTIDKEIAETGEVIYER